MLKKQVPEQKNKLHGTPKGPQSKPKGSNHITLALPVSSTMTLHKLHIPGRRVVSAHITKETSMRQQKIPLARNQKSSPSRPDASSSAVFPACRTRFWPPSKKSTMSPLRV